MEFIKGEYEALNQPMKQVQDNKLTIIGDKMWGHKYLEYTEVYFLEIYKMITPKVVAKVQNRDG